MRIYREIYVAQSVHIEPLRVVSGSNAVGIELKLMDFVPLSGSTATFVAESIDYGTTRTAAATLEGTTIMCYPPKNMFAPGKNNLQVNITSGGSTYLSFLLPVVADKEIQYRYTPGTTKDEIQQLVDRAVSSATTISQKIDNFESAPAWVNPNLLDNWFFEDPINQRGQTAYHDPGYTIDRWTTENSGYDYTLAVSPSLGRIELRREQHPAYLKQYVNYTGRALHSHELTLSALVYGSGSINIQDSAGHGTSAYYDSGSWGICKLNFTTSENSENLRVWIESVAGQSFFCRAIKLEVGRQQTLARIVNGEWVLSEVPNRALELEKCKRFFQRIQGSASLEIGVSDVINNTDIFPGLKIAPMRTTPVVSVSDLSKLFITQAGANSGSTASSVSLHGWSPDGTATLRITASNLVNAAFYRIVLAAGEKLDFSADL